MFDRPDTAIATPASSSGPHRQWLAERNALLLRLNANGEEDLALHRDVTRRELAIANAPPATCDDVISKLVYIAQTVIEGSTPNDELVAVTIVEARRFLRMGSLAGASVAIRETFDA